MGGISIWQLLIVVAIIVLLFGTKKLRTLGSDLGESVKGFKKAMSDEKKDAGFENVEKVEVVEVKESVSTEQQQTVVKDKEQV